MTEIPDKIDLSNNEHVQAVRNEITEMIEENQKSADNFGRLWKEASPDYVPTLKQFYAAVTMMYNQHIETLEMGKRYFEGFVSLNKELKEKTEQLQKEVNRISEQTCVDLSDLKEHVAKMKQAMDEPIYKYVKQQETDAEKKKKLEDELLDWAIRSH
jgi:hypothetical protein